MAVPKLLLRLYLASVYGVIGGLRAISSGIEQLGAWRGRSPHELGSGSSPAPPKRVAIVVAEHEQESVSDEKAAQVLYWCYQADVELVSLYDPAGYLKARLDRIQQQLELLLCAHMSQQHVGQSAAEEQADEADAQQTGGVSTATAVPAAVQPPILLQAGWKAPQPDATQVPHNTVNDHQHRKQPQQQQAADTSAADTQAVSVGSTSCRFVQLQSAGGVGLQQGGDMADGRMRVAVLSAEDAFTPVLQTIQNSSKQELGPIKTPDRSHQQASLELHHRLQAAAGPEAVQEAQLIMVYGNEPLTLAGFPPWLARVAEILGMGPLHSATHTEFMATMDRFCNIKQRFGK